MEMNTKIKELQTLCVFYHLDLTVKYYDSHEVCFKGVNDDEQEVFNVCVWYPNNRSRKYYIELDSTNEKWRGGQFTKEDMLLLLSIDDLDDKELNIEPSKVSVNEKEN